MEVVSTPGDPSPHPFAIDQPDDAPITPQRSKIHPTVVRGRGYLRTILHRWSNHSVSALNSTAFAVGQLVATGELPSGIALECLRLAGEARGYDKRYGADFIGALEGGYTAGLAFPALPANDNDARALPIIEACELANRTVGERKFIVPGFIPDRTVTLLSGDGGIGKGHLTFQLMASMALGTAWCGLPVASGPSLYLGAEDELDDLHRRLIRITEHHGRDLSELKGVYLVPIVDADPLLAAPQKSALMAETPLLALIRAEAYSHAPKLIVLDASADLFGGNEVDRNQVRQFIGMLRKLAMDIDSAVVLLTHPSVAGISTGTGLSGSTAWNNSVRSRLYLDCPDGDDADPDVRRLTVMKSNYAERGAQLMLRWQDGVLVPDTGPDPTVTDLVDGKVEDVFVDLLTLFTDQGQNLGVTPGTTYAPAIMARHPKAKGINKKQLAAAMQRLLDAKKIRIETSGPPSKQRRRLVLTATDIAE